MTRASRDDAASRRRRSSTPARRRDRLRSDPADCVSGQQSSAGSWNGTPTSQTGVVCVPSGRLPPAPGRLTTAHCSPSALAPPRSCEARDFLLEHLVRAPRSRGTSRSSSTPAPAARRRRAAPPRSRARPPRASTPPRSPARAARAPRARAAPLRRSRRPRGRARQAARAARESRRPCNRPPTIATTPRSKLSIDRRAASTLVAFESLTNRTPPISPDRLHHVREPVETRAAPPTIASGCTPAMLRRRGRRQHVVQHVAAGQLHRRTAESAARRRCRCAARSSRRRRRSRRRSTPSSENIDARAPRCPRCAPSPPRSSAFTHRPVVRVLVREDARLRRRVRLDGRMPIEMVVGEVEPDAQSTDGTSWSSRAESCWPRRRASCRASTARPARSAARRCCRRPARALPAAASIRPISVVVVDFPFVPVTAITRPVSQRDASSSSPMISTPRCARRVEHRLLERHARTRDDQVGCGKRRGRCARRARAPRPPRCSAIRLVERRRAFRSASRALLACAAAPPPRCRFAPRRPPPPAARAPRSQSHPRHHRSFSVVRLNSAKMTATIRKRAMTFGSLQPISSKWW